MSRRLLEAWAGASLAKDLTGIGTVQDLATALATGSFQPLVTVGDGPGVAENAGTFGSRLLSGAAAKVAGGIGKLPARWARRTAQHRRQSNSGHAMDGKARQLRAKPTRLRGGMYGCRGRRHRYALFACGSKMGCRLRWYFGALLVSSERVSVEVAARLFLDGVRDFVHGAPPIHLVCVYCGSAQFRDRRNTCLDSCGYA
jgi:hypothetical protein